MPLPLPELASEIDGMFADGVQEFVCGERKTRGVKDAGADVEEGNDQEKLKGIDDVAAQLRGGDVEPEDEGGGEAEDSGAAEDWVDADEKPGGDAPG